MHPNIDELLKKIAALDYENQELIKSLEEKDKRLILLRNRIHFMLDNINSACITCAKRIDFNKE